MNLLVDPLVCLARRESPEDSAPACGEWLSAHCPDCDLCPGLHADDCTFVMRPPRASRVAGCHEIPSPPDCPERTQT